MDSPHAVGYERTECFDHQFAGRLLGARYAQSIIVTENADVGLPCWRERLVARALNVELVLETRVEFTHTELLRLCGCRVVSTGKMFLGSLARRQDGYAGDVRQAQNDFALWRELQQQSVAFNRCTISGCLR